MKKLLYITWDGPQVNYLESLFSPIFNKLKDFGYDIYIYQFSWKKNCDIINTKKICNDYGLHYFNVHIIRRPKKIGALFSMMIGAFYLSRIIKNNKIDIVIGRSILPAFVYLMIGNICRVKFIYDSDGLLVEEMIEDGRINANGLIVKALKKIENLSIKKSAVVLTRSKIGSNILNSTLDKSEIEKFAVVKNGRNIHNFKIEDLIIRNARRFELGISPDAPIVVYIGSLGGKYDLIQMLKLFQKIKKFRSDSIMLLISRSLDKFHEISDLELKKGVKIFTVGSDEIPYYLSIADLGLSLIRPTLSMTAASAIKTGEYLLCGIPVVATKGIGDISEFIHNGIGYLVNEKIDDQEYLNILNWFFNDVLINRDIFRKKCRVVGIREYSLDAAVLDYKTAIDRAIINSQ